ncbi:MAG: dihydroneopterin aldolase [Rhodospirillales bacterium]|jgi:dihydroneopterin aldolase|nr:dihydroneopterin aldolase [Rhodospirillales bacterium]MDP6643121.1 dihydroneopterin aldolase [Rhodospirillales bacterium]MDP6842187.1 dihydroneopterin aldolase [Rhodospirillales bacterium]|tara:strand:- start:2202 stop:2618 length:417 start_codon:yes stop_codon:yes gene_type:complete
MSTTDSNVIHAFRIADAEASVRHVFIRDLVLTCLIGVHKHERKQPQRIRINLDLAVSEGARLRSDRLRDVVCYEDVADGIRALVGSGHVNLVETLAENIADLCLSDERVRVARVRVEKLDIFEDAVSAGVEIERFRPD